jgi:plastocyanin
MAPALASPGCGESRRSPADAVRPANPSYDSEAPMNELRRRILLAAAGMAGVLIGVSLFRMTTLRAQGSAREFTINANQFAFSPLRIDVQKDDLVKITFTATDIAHSFTLDQYRIAKRAGAGQTVVFEFRADQPGTHRFYCNLSQDDRCRRMEGQLVVR